MNLIEERNLIKMSMLFRNVITKVRTCSYQALTYCTKVIAEQTSPIISKVSFQDEKFLYQKPREVWIENLDTIERKKLGLITLHPDVFGASPRIDIVHQNVRWQRMYRWVVIVKLYQLFLKKILTLLQQLENRINALF